MTSKDIILSNIRDKNHNISTPLPVMEDFGIKYDDKMEQFSQTMQIVGGEALSCDIKKLDETIANLYPDAKVISSNVKQCKLGNFDTNIQKSPNDLKDLDLAIIKGEFGVAENAAVWIKNPENIHRALYFIAQNIVIVVDKNNIIDNMHQAYEKIEFEKSGFGVFVSGPSKTADIEQSLVIGAHGAKSLYVVFV